jgi:hypothetical protein
MGCFVEVRTVSFLKEMRDLLRPETAANTRSDEVAPANPLFVYVKMPGDLDPEDRHERFAEPLREALEKEGFGTVTGGGSCFAPPDEDGGDEVVFCGVDVDLYNAEGGFALLRDELIRLGAPSGTTLLYELDGHEYEEPIYRAIA